MDNAFLPKSQDLVLVGGGHTHALVLRKWGMAPLAGARVTLINPGPSAPYSGMLPGFLAGHYDRDDLDIDLVRLARFAGARIIFGAADAIEINERLVHVPGRPPVAYDVLSVDIGITSDMPKLPGFAAHGAAAKPLGPFARKWQDYLDHGGNGDIVVIGGGVAGAEIVMAMAHALQQRERSGTPVLIDSAQALSALGPGARHKLLTRIKDLGIRVLEGANVARIEQGRVILDTGEALAAGFVVGAARARPYDWVAQSGLSLHDGFIAVDETLCSSDKAVFAVGDCAHMTHSPRPKAGVFAVRQAPVLFENLRARLIGGTLVPYRPQRDYLKLISLGKKSALAERLNRSLSGSLMWQWKDRIDRKFMDQFRDLPEMAQPDLPPVHALGLKAAMGDKPLCGGCGAKVGRGALRQALDARPAVPRADITPLPGDDAALVQFGQARYVQSIDHLRAMVEDPVIMARIAAVHSLGDIWAMGATPRTALASVILPRLSETLQRRSLEEIMESADAVMHAAGAEIIGGHSSTGSELTIGFAVTGVCESDPITLAGGRAGDALILTKPLGSGLIMAAEMAGRAKGAWVEDALTLMTTPQSEAARILAGAHAMTDVTGFGLAGHLQGICEASGTGARLILDAVPVLPGAVTLFEAGVRSSIFEDNRAIVPSLPASGKAGVLFDPQTSGGLLAAVSADAADAFVERLRAQGCDAARIGHLTEGPCEIRL